MMNDKIFALLILLVISTLNLNAKGGDREYWCEMAYKISHPVLKSLSENELKKLMPLETTTGYANPGSLEPAYLEALGRTLCGIAPWLELPNDNTKESEMREELLGLAHKSIRNIVDPKSSDYVDFSKGHQPLVDAAFLAQAFLRSPQKLWGGLDTLSKEMVIKAFYSTRVIKPNRSNWLLFSAMIETFFLSIGENWDAMRIDYALLKHDEWYKGDGIYGDGENFHWDYYNSYVIQPMLVDIYRVMYDNKKCVKEKLEQIIAHSMRYAQVQERLISPEGTFPPIGRSLCYRTGAFQTLGQMALLKSLPSNISEAQVRSALTAVTKRCFEMDGNFDQDGWLTLGFVGHQKQLAEYYVNTGSLYLTMVGFLPLGLAADDSFWISPPEKWTSQKVWSGEEIPIDYAR